MRRSVPGGITPQFAVAAGSLVALGLLVAALAWRGGPDRAARRPLVALVAASSRRPMEAIARQYRDETGQSVELRFGASEEILAQATLPNPAGPADLFLPADDSYVRQARDRGLVAEEYPVAGMRAVVLTAPDNQKRIGAWADLLRPGVRVSMPNPAAAVGKLTRDRLAADGRWDALAPRVVSTGNVVEAANAAKLGAVDAAVVWDAVAANYPGQDVVEVSELAGVVARVRVAVLARSRDPGAAGRFARYVASPQRGLIHFQAAGFRVAPTSASDAGPPEKDR